MLKAKDIEEKPHELNIFLRQHYELVNEENSGCVRNSSIPAGVFYSYLSLVQKSFPLKICFALKRQCPCASNLLGTSSALEK